MKEVAPSPERHIKPRLAGLTFTSCSYRRVLTTLVLSPPHQPSPAFHDSCDPGGSVEFLNVCVAPRNASWAPAQDLAPPRLFALGNCSLAGGRPR